MRHFTAAEVHDRLPYPELVVALEQMFKTGCEAPPRHHHTISTAGSDATLLLMPAWLAGQGRQDRNYVGVKQVTVFPDNGERGLPAIMGSYLLLDGESGAPLAVMDGAALTARRTAAASALAVRYLAREDAETLLMVGTGVLAPHLIAAHCAMRPIKQVMVWGRNIARAEAIVADLVLDRDITVGAISDLKPAISKADLISCATLSKNPLIAGDLLSPGTHIDLVGGFTPQMREADDSVIQRSDIYVDTLAGATKEAGDIVQPIANGHLAVEEIAGELHTLCTGAAVGRTNANQITLFKSVGASLEDLAAAIMIWETRSVIN
jgi:ornithine cyclodeaminase/alanine dehydrogenase-like protein (mu-crystallin family)